MKSHIGIRHRLIAIVSLLRGMYYLAPRRIGDVIVLCARSDMYMEGLPKRPSLDKLFGDWFYARVDF